MTTLLENSKLEEIYLTGEHLIEDVMKTFNEDDWMSYLVGVEDLSKTLTDDLIQGSKLERIVNRVDLLTSGNLQLDNAEAHLNKVNDSLANIASELVETVNVYGILDFLPTQIDEAEVQELMSEVIGDVLNQFSPSDTTVDVLTMIVLDLMKFMNSECRRDMEFVFQKMLDADFQALKMVDATAKIPSGLLMGNTKLWGRPSVCRGVKIEDDVNNRTVGGRYSAFKNL